MDGAAHQFLYALHVGFGLRGQLGYVGGIGRRLRPARKFLVHGPAPIQQDRAGREMVNGLAVNLVTYADFEGGEAVQHV